jgi:para-nitrobenzyl esterase
LENSERVTALVFDSLGVTDMDALQQAPMDAVFDAYLQAVKSNNGNDTFRPVIDGKTIIGNPFDVEALEFSADVPLMIGTAETEKAFYDVIVDPAGLALTEAQITTKTAAFVGITEAQAAVLIGGYRIGREAESERDIFNRITSDQMYRRNCVEAAEKKSSHGGAPTFLYEFTYRIPALGGILRSPHTMCLPFVFGTTKIAELFTGAGPEQDALTNAVQGAWVAFARTGNPNHAGLAQWSPYDAKTRPTMIFDKECRQALAPKPEDLARITACPPFVTDEMRKTPA